MQIIFTSVDTPEELRRVILEASQIIATPEGLLIQLDRPNATYILDVRDSAWVPE